MFYKSYDMHEHYLTYRDIVFINKRFTKTRFNKIMLLFCGVNSQGKTVIFGVCFIAREDEDCYEYALSHFKSALASDGNPRTFIIERNS